MFQLCFNIGKGADFNQDMTRVGPIMRWGGNCASQCLIQLRLCVIALKQRKIKMAMQTFKIIFLLKAEKWGDHGNSLSR